MENVKTKRRRSNPLNKEEVKAFKRWIKTHPTIEEGCVAAGITRPTFDRLKRTKSASIETVTKIKTVINA